MVSNEIYTGAGASVTLVPEMEFIISEGFGTTKGSVILLERDTTTKTTLKWTVNNSSRLVPDLYKGCMAKLEKYNASGASQDHTQTLMIKSNTEGTLVFAQNIDSDSAALWYKCTILSFGAPVYSPAAIGGKPSLLADNWLGLVSTFTAPTVTPQIKQMNLALGGTRNFGFQFNGAEDIGEASIDVSLNNGSWLYYALGKMSYSATQISSNTLNASLVDGSSYGLASSGSKIHRVEDSKILPPIDAEETLTAYKEITGYVDYTFTENNSGDLPSFTLEVTNEKGNVTDANYMVDSNREKVMSRIYTGCQVNTMTLNFEEGMEVTANISAMSRKAQNADTGYVPKRKVRTTSALKNFSSDSEDNIPYMYSDGTIKMYGQTLARVKSGNITISNNLTAQRYIGNYDRTITSAQTAGQRTYEISLVLLITDRTIWDELRKQTETDNTTGLIELEFSKSSTDKIVLKFNDYITTSVDIPFPDDKGAIEVAITASARTLDTCTYTGKWIIQG